MYQKPTIFGVPPLSGSFPGDPQVQGCTTNSGDGVCDCHNPSNPPSGCGTLRDIGVSVGGGLITGGIAAKVAFPGPTDAI